MSYVTTIKQVLFFVYDLLSDELRSVIEVVGELFDDIKTDFETVLSQIDPNEATVTGLLLDYERFYRCVPGSGDTVATRRERVVAAIRAKGGLNRSHFENIAEALGYTVGTDIDITEGDFAPFRADYGRADIDAVYDQGDGKSMYTVVVTGNGVEDDNDLQQRFDKQHCCGIEFVYVNT